MAAWPVEVPLPEGATVRQVWPYVVTDCGPVAVLGVDGGGEFLCLGCGANALTDGYTETEDGASQWAADAHYITDN